jgi:hypothetical protein
MQQMNSLVEQFEALRKQMEDFDSEREVIIKVFLVNQLSFTLYFAWK